MEYEPFGSFNCAQKTPRNVRTLQENFSLDLNEARDAHGVAELCVTVPDTRKRANVSPWTDLDL